MHTFQNHIQSGNIPGIISARKKAGRLSQKYFQESTFLLSQNSLFRKNIEDRLYSEPILQITGNGVEFASETLISPEYIEVLKKKAKTAERKRKARQNHIDRVKRSHLRREKPPEAALGNIGNNLDAYEKVLREKRYRIQEFIQKNRLGKFEFYNDETGEIHEKTSAVQSCGTPISDAITVRKNTLHGNVNHTGVATCGSVWGCPVCRAKIVNQRAQELKDIYTRGKAKGWYFTLFTFTFSHSKNDNLAELYGSSNLREGLSGALTRFRQSRTWSKKFRDDIEYIGDIRAVEVTWGLANGFHPHIHMIVISSQKIDANKWQNNLLKEWQNSCKKAGIGIPNERGLKIDPVNSYEPVQYLSKWSVGSELSSDSAKQAKGKNYSIAALESMLINEKARGLQGLGLDRICGILKSYYSAMHGQKQLVYGGTQTGWKKALQVEEISDAGISEDEFQDEHECDLFIITKTLYKDIKAANLWGGLAEYLEKLNKHSSDSYHHLYFAREYLSKHGINLDGRIYHPDQYH